MEENHMPAAQCPPQAKPRENPARAGTTIQDPTSPDALAATSPTPMHTSPNRDSHDHKQSGDFSARFNTALSLQLPPLALSFPGDPATELAPIQPPHGRPAGSSVRSLPPLSSVTGAQAHVPLPKPPEPSHPAPHTKQTNHWPSLNPFTTYYTPSHLDPGESSPSMGSDRSVSHRGASVSLDDPDVRIAAEALGQMRTDCGSSPRNLADRKTSRDYKTTSLSPQSNVRSRAEQEPLLSLITTSHPLLATTIEGAASAYNTSKNYSPHIKTSAEYVENCLKPVGKAVGNVGRKTGVEGGVRWIFGIRSKKQHATTDIETGERGNSKRRKSDRSGKAPQDTRGTPCQDSDAESEDRRMSVSTVDTLPAYDDSRSPAYTEVADDNGPPDAGSGAAGQQWGQRFVVTTSGLGVAMKQESLRSLKYCVRVVKDTNGYISQVLVSLKSVIDEYDRGSRTDDEDHNMADGGDHAAQHTTADRNRLIQRMGELRDDLFRVIQRTVETVSKYAGSALPDNARNLVHRQLMSLPGLYQFHYVRESQGRSESASPEVWARDSAHLALLFAKEALQMMTQVGDVLNRTLVSAEEWCETLYRKKNEQLRSPLSVIESLPATPAAGVSQDSNMSG